MFTVVIPVYNHAKFVRGAIWSALRCPLAKEILVLDDGSRDDSARILAEMAAAHPGRIRDLTPPAGGNRGAHHRLNELVEQARFEWIAVLNSDDTFVSGRFEAIVQAPGFSTCDFAFGNLLYMDERGGLIGAKRGPLDTWKPFRPSFDQLRMAADGRFGELLLDQNFLVSTSNMAFRKSLHVRVGGFRDYRYVHDWDFALRALQPGAALYVSRFLTAYRIHGNNTIMEDEQRAWTETRAMLRAHKTQMA